MRVTHRNNDGTYSMPEFDDAQMARERYMYIVEKLGAMEEFAERTGLDVVSLFSQDVPEESGREYLAVLANAFRLFNEHPDAHLTVKRVYVDSRVVSDPVIYHAIWHKGYQEEDTGVWAVEGIDNFMEEPDLEAEGWEDVISIVCLIPSDYEAKYQQDLEDAYSTNQIGEQWAQSELQDADEVENEPTDFEYDETVEELDVLAQIKEKYPEVNQYLEDLDREFFRLQRECREIEEHNTAVAVAVADEIGLERYVELFRENEQRRSNQYLS